VLKIKICGVTRVEDALAAAEEGADYVGLIFAQSPRCVDIPVAAEIVRQLPAGTEAVGVFRNQSLGIIRQTAGMTGIRMVQLHGGESPDLCRDVVLPVIKTFETFDDETLRRLETYDTFAYLLDLPKESDVAQIDADWAVRAKGRGRVIAAGKLTPDTVGDLVLRILPWGVDVASGTENAPGIKDRARVRDFIRAAREASLAGNRRSAS
jgi:phosphoribosylanthranilate isomerase